MTQTLKSLLNPRQSVFDLRSRDDVYHITDLDTINAASFFAQNFVTQGMKTLLTQVFSRLDGSNPEASGAFLLSQAMGGGKTHNLIALGLLAQNPSLREQVMGSFYDIRPFGKVRVISFSGRENPQYGLWGDIAEKLYRKEEFSRFYTPLQAPGESDWIRLFRDDNVLILMDEIPPYLNQAMQVSLGQSTLAHATATAIANLLSAINTGKLPNVTLVMTDLSGKSYPEVADRIAQITGTLEQESKRTVQTIQPVRLNSTEPYDILRTRLFETLPDKNTIDAISDEYRQVLENAGRIMDIPVAHPDRLQSTFRNTWPFHPYTMDLFARFRENQGYQQTRALLRIMRGVIAELWESGRANDLSSIGPQHINVGDDTIYSEIEKINSNYLNAISHDIYNVARNAVAQTVDGAKRHNAQDVARLVLMSSLSTATNPVLGLNSAEMLEFLASPDRDINRLQSDINELRESAWYLHTTADGKLLFRTTENVRARVQSTLHNVKTTDVLGPIRQKLTEIFAPKLRDVYQAVEALPDLADLRITQDVNTLAIVRPDFNQTAQINDFYNALEFKNRVLFISSGDPEYNTVVDRMRYLHAARQVEKELTNDNIRLDDPQMVELRSIIDSSEANFYMALREAFQTLRYPSRDRVRSIEFRPEYKQGYDGEKIVREELVAMHQFADADAMMSDHFRERLEREFWPHGSQEVPWAQIRKEAAQQPSFLIHTPAKLEDVKNQAIRRGFWREVSDGKYIQKGPFEQEKARILSVRTVSEPDRETGEVTLRVNAVNADRVAFVHSDGRTTPVQGDTITLTDLRGEFVAQDSTGNFPPAPPYEWENTIAIRYQTHDVNNQRHVTLQAVPDVPIRYTTDGSSPLTSGKTYHQPFPIPDEGLLILALAEAEGVRAEEQFRIPAREGGQAAAVDPAKPAIWKREIKTSSTAETFGLLKQLNELAGLPHGVVLEASHDNHFVVFETDETTSYTPANVERAADFMMELHTGWELTLKVKMLSFANGQGLLDFVADRLTEIKPEELVQTQ